MYERLHFMDLVVESSAPLPPFPSKASPASHPFSLSFLWARHVGFVRTESTGGDTVVVMNVTITSVVFTVTVFLL